MWWFLFLEEKQFRILRPIGDLGIERNLVPASVVEADI
jgi:hypothetical protein